MTRCILYAGSTCSRPDWHDFRRRAAHDPHLDGVAGRDGVLVGRRRVECVGESTLSDCAAATTLSGTPAAPTSLAVTGANLSSLTLDVDEPPAPVSSFEQHLALTYGTRAESLTR